MSGAIDSSVVFYKLELLLAYGHVLLIGFVIISLLYLLLLKAGAMEYLRAFAYFKYYYSVVCWQGFNKLAYLVRFK